MINIKIFRVDAVPEDGGQYYEHDGDELEIAEEELLKQLNAWVSVVEPTILNIEYKKRTGNVLDREEAPRYCFMRVIYGGRKE